MVNIVSYLMQILALFCIRTRANLTIALNQTLYRELLKMGFPKSKLAILGAGIDLKGITKHELREKEQCDGVYLGRLHVAKGVFDTIHIWKEVVEKRKNAQLVIIGDGPEIVKRELEKQIEPVNLKENIKVLGFLSQNQVYDYLKSAKVFLFTDHEAGWGLAIAEAMACKLPIVGYDIGVLGDVYKKGFKVISLGDFTGFAREIVNFLEDPGLREKFSRLAFEESKRLDWEETTRKFYALTQTLISNKTHDF